MRKALSAVCLLAVVALGAGRAEEANPADATTMAIVVSSSVDTALVARVCGLASSQLGRQVVWRADDRLAAWTNGPAAVAVLRQAGEDLVVAVIDPGTASDSVALSRQARTALVNVHPLRGPKGAEGEAGLYAERVEREVLRAFGMLRGLPPCPAPFCVMSPHHSLGDLDKKGRGFCPPCMLRASGDIP